MHWAGAGGPGEGRQFGVSGQTRVEKALVGMPPANDSSLRMSALASGPENPGSRPRGPVLVMPNPPDTGKQRKLWVQRLWLIIVVLFCMELGIILTILPWTRLWTGNSFLLGHPQLRAVLMNNFVRGVVAGLGLVDIWIAVAEAIRYRETSK